MSAGNTDADAICCPDIVVRLRWIALLHAHRSSRSMYNTPRPKTMSQETCVNPSVAAAVRSTAVHIWSEPVPAAVRLERLRQIAASPEYDYVYSSKFVARRFTTTNTANKHNPITTSFKARPPSTVMALLLTSASMGHICPVYARDELRVLRRGEVALHQL